MMSPHTARRWFTRVAWAGVAGNLALGIPLLAAPVELLEAASLPTASQDVWPRLAGLLLVLLSVFYMPAAVDPDRYRTIAWFTIASRFAGGVFFLLEGPAFRPLAAYDLTFFVLQAGLLAVAAKSGAGAAAPGAAHL